MSKRTRHGRLKKLTFIQRQKKDERNERRNRPEYVYVVTQQGRFRIPRVGGEVVGDE